MQLRRCRQNETMTGLMGWSLPASFGRTFRGRTPTRPNAGSLPVPPRNSSVMLTACRKHATRASAPRAGNPERRLAFHSGSASCRLVHSPVKYRNFRGNPRKVGGVWPYGKPAPPACRKRGGGSARGSLRPGIPHARPGLLDVAHVPRHHGEIVDECRGAEKPVDDRHTYATGFGRA